MNITKKTLFFFILVVILGSGLPRFMAREERIEKSDMRLRVGSGDDITGLLLEQIINTSKQVGINSLHATEKNEDILFDFTFKDC